MEGTIQDSFLDNLRGSNESRTTVEAEEVSNYC